MQWIGYTRGPLVNQVIQALGLSAVSFLALSLLSDSTGSTVCGKDCRILGSLSGRHSYTVNANP